MNARSTKLKQYEKKISAQLQQAKSQLEQFKTRARKKKAQAEIEAIKALKTRKRRIDKMRQDMQTSGRAKAAQIKAEIGVDMARLKTSLEQLATRLKDKATQKPSLAHLGYPVYCATILGTWMLLGSAAILAQGPMTEIHLQALGTDARRIAAVMKHELPHLEEKESSS